MIFLAAAIILAMIAVGIAALISWFVVASVVTMVTLFVGVLTALFGWFRQTLKTPDDSKRLR